MTSKAKADIEESLEAIEDFKQELAELEEELNEELAELNDRWGEVAAEIEETVITPYKKNILMDLFGVAWFPYWRLEQNGETFEVPGYQV
jgi:hypothetical protein